MAFPSLTAALLSKDSMVVEFGGRWFITVGNPGFNTRANNGRGYRTADLAWAAIRRHDGKAAAR